MTARNLLAAYRRAANILRIEEKKDGPPTPHRSCAAAPAGRGHLAGVLDRVEPEIAGTIRTRTSLPPWLAWQPCALPSDGFFDRVTVNDTQSELRYIRLRLLARVRAVMNLAADFSRIEG